MRAYVLINTSPGRALELTKRLRDVPSVKDADVITGEYDIIVVCEAESLKELSALIVGDIQNLEGVFKTTTCLAIM